jgi:hypothetical protein
MKTEITYPFTLNLEKNKKLDRIEIFKDPFTRFNFFINEKYAGRITDDGKYPEDYLLIRENLTSIARRLEDSFQHSEKENFATLHENHYDPTIEKKTYNLKDLAIYHPNDKQYTPDGRFWYHTHLDINTELNHQVINIVLQDLKEHDIISEKEYRELHKEVIKYFQENIPLSLNTNIVPKSTALTTTATQVLKLNQDVRYAEHTINQNNQNFEYLAEKNTQYSPTPAKSFKLPQNIEQEEKKAIKFACNQ